MKRALAFLGVFILVFGTLVVMPNETKAAVRSDDERYWFKDYRGPDFNNSYGGVTGANDIAFTPDGDIIVAGDTDIFGAGQIDTWVMKLDKCGSIVWQKSYGGSGDDITSSVAVAPNGDIIVAGWTGGSFSSDDGDWDLWVLCLNDSGSIIWQKNYGGSVNDGYSTVSLAVDPNGDIIVASSTLMDDAYKDMWLLRLDGNGVVKWDKTYGGEYDDDYAEAVSIASNGDIVVVGVTWVYGNGGGAWVLRLDLDGNIKWQNVYERSMALDLASGLTIDPSGNIIVSGSTGSLSGEMDGWLLYLDGNGSVQWSKSYSYKDSGDISELALVPDGDIVGTSGDYVLRTSANGTLEWAKWTIDGEMVGPKILPDGTAVMAGGEAHAFTVGRFNIDEVPQYSGWHNPEDVEWDGWGDVDIEVSDISLDVADSVVESSAIPRLFNATVNNISAEIHNASAEVTTTTVWCSITLTAPRNLQATAGDGRIILSWDQPVDDGGCNIIEYRIYRSTASGGEVYYTSVNGSTTTYTDNNVVNGQTYYYKVSAVNTVCEGPESNESSATVNSGVIRTPSAPQALQAVAGGNVTLSWSLPSDDGGSNITEYKIYRSITSDTEIYYDSVEGTTTSYIDTNVINGVTYYYKVSAVNSAGEGSWSNEVSVTPLNSSSAGYPGNGSGYNGTSGTSDNNSSNNSEGSNNSPDIGGMYLLLTITVAVGLYSFSRKRKNHP